MELFCLDINEVTVKVKEQVLLDHISFQVNKGKITALVGHNGAGKSTTMKTIMGWQEKDAGRIHINGISQDKDFLEYKKLFSYIPEEPLLLSELTVYQHFQLFGTSYQIPEEQFKQKVDYYIKKFDLTDKQNEYPEALSKGMRQKVQTICALLPDVPLLLIDEPFMGLDIYASAFLEEELIKRAKLGTAILLTSHQLEKVKELSDDYILLKDGQIIEEGVIDNFAGLQRRNSDE